MSRQNPRYVDVWERAGENPSTVRTTAVTPQSVASRYPPAPGYRWEQGSGRTRGATGRAATWVQVPINPTPTPEATPEQPAPAAPIERPAPISQETRNEATQAINRANHYLSQGGPRLSFTGNTTQDIANYAADLDERSGQNISHLRKRGDASQTLYTALLGDMAQILPPAPRPMDVEQMASAAERFSQIKFT